MFLVSLLVLFSCTSVSFADFEDYHLFCGDFFKNIDPGSGKNFIASPAIIRSVLYVLQRGSKSKTLEELQQVLKTPKDQAQADKIISTYANALDNEPDHYQTVRSVYVTSKVTIPEDFQKLIKNVYKSHVESLDFGYEGAAEVINLETREKSDDYVLRTIKPEDLSESTSKIVAIAGIVYIGEWTVKFPPQLTSFQPFKARNEPVPVLTMNNPNAKVLYAKSSGLQLEVLKLSMKDAKQSFWVVLPEEGGSVDSIPLVFPQLISLKFTEKSVNVSLPQFQIDNLLDVQSTLQQLGIKKIFDPSADLSGIGGSPGDIFVNKFVHKTEIRINEAGLEQAAIDPVGVEGGKAEVQFNVNRPFYFFYFYGSAVISGGKVVDPLQFT